MYFNQMSIWRTFSRTIKLCLLSVLLIWDAKGQDELPQTHSPAFYCGFINDNYTGDVQQGIDGKYFGADDFLTFSLYAEVKQERWDGAIVYNMLTSRKLMFRSDILTATLSRSYQRGKFTVQPGAGMIVSNNLGGERLQNWFHRLTNVPEVSIPFQDPDLGLFLTAVASTDLFANRLVYGTLSSTSELRLTSGIVPSRVTQILEYSSDPILRRLRIGARAGARVYLNEVTGYSEMLRAGLLGGIQVEGNLFADIHLRFGVMLYPGQNLDTDPLYMKKEFRYMPQITTLIAWNGNFEFVQEYLKY